MERVLRGVSATLSKTIYVSGVATDPSPDSATVTITRADGTVLVTAGGATNDGTGLFSYTLTPTQTSLLDRLSVAWTFTLAGQVQTLTDRVEVVGGYHFNIADIRAFDPLSDTVKYPAAKIADARTLAESALEDACGVAFVPRYASKTISGPGTTVLLLSPFTTAVRSVSASGVAYTAGQLSALITDGNMVVNPSRWELGTSNLTIVYEHGYAECPPWVSRASMLLTKHFLVDSPIDERFTSVSSEHGTFSMVTPGVRGALTSIPEVNSVIESYRVPVLA